MQSDHFQTTVLPLFHGNVDSKQQEGIDAILKGCDLYQVTDQRMKAYILATCYWETDRTMQPIEEYGKGHGHIYGGKIKQSGDSYLLPDEIYYGRGHTQNTWFENYQMLQNQRHAIAKGWRFLERPETLLQMEPSVWATIHCMWFGSYTGVGLSHYFNDNLTDPFNARKIINGLDQAKNIAGFYQIFYTALTTA